MNRWNPSLRAVALTRCGRFYVAPHVTDEFGNAAYRPILHRCFSLPPCDGISGHELLASWSVYTPAASSDGGCLLLYRFT